MDDLMKQVCYALNVCAHMRPLDRPCDDCYREREELELAALNYSEELAALRNKHGS